MTSQNSLYKVFFLASSILFLAFLQSPAFSEAQTEDNNNYDKLLTIGAFASLEKPSDPNNIEVKYEETFDQCQPFYVGILIQNNNKGTDTVKVKVRYTLKGKTRKGKETFEYAVKPGLNVFSICDVLCRPSKANKDEYSYKMTMFSPSDRKKINGSAKIRVHIRKNGPCGDNQTPTPTITPPPPPPPPPIETVTPTITPTITPVDVPDETETPTLTLQSL